MKMWSESDTVRKKMSISTDVQNTLTYHRSSTTNIIYVKGTKKNRKSGMVKKEKKDAKEFMDMKAVVKIMQTTSPDRECFLR